MQFQSAGLTRSKILGPNPKLLEKLVDLLPGSSTAEDDMSILGEVFSEVSAYAGLSNFAGTNLKIVIGKKGSGKTACLLSLRDAFRTHGMHAESITPADLQLGLQGVITVADSRARSREAIVRVSAQQLGKTLSGWLNSPQSKLRESAVEAGLAERDTVSKLATTLQNIGSKVAALDVGPLGTALNLLSSVPVQSQTTAKTNTLSRAMAESLKSSKSTFLLLIDDVDQLTSGNEWEKVLLMGFLLGARDAVSDIKGLRVIISLKEDLWIRLESDASGPLDQIDHFSKAIHRIHCTDSDISQIVLKRCQLVTHANYQQLGPPIFERTRVLVGKKLGDRNWLSVLVRHSRRRPRDVLQFLKALALFAISKRKPTIDQDCYEAVLKLHSMEIQKFTVNEWNSSLDPIRKVMEEVFGNRKSWWKAEELRDALKAAPTRFGIRLYGKTVRGSDREAVDLMRTLHAADFLFPRQFDATAEKQYKHIWFEDDPHYYKWENWSRIQQDYHQVNPVFWDSLSIVSGLGELLKLEED